MCIRDSPDPAPRRAAAGRHPQSRRRPETENRRQDRGSAPTCLLYTSDAADDLPCVDLGGRRIIKKKTHTLY